MRKIYQRCYDVITYNMSTHNERQQAKATKRKAHFNSQKNLTEYNNYSHWIYRIRCIGIERGLTLSEVRTKININTIGNMFLEGKTPKQAYSILIN